MKEIKFRCWIPSENFMGVPFDPFEDDNDPDKSGHWPDDAIFLQFTGQLDAHGKPIYEGDILRTTIEEEFGDINHYFIVTWIKEWAIFAALFHSEYPHYETSGAKALDESMFWTFTIESDNTFTVCGNIYEHPDYIKKCMDNEEKAMNNEL